MVEAEENIGTQLTEVGVIPEDWKVKPLRCVADFGSGTTPSRSLSERYFVNGTVHWVKTMDLNNGHLYDTGEKVTDVALREVGSLKVYPPETVLVAMYGGFNQIGRTGILKIDAAVNQALVAVQAHKNKLDPDYLIHYLNYRVDYWKQVASSSRKDPNITSNDVKLFPIALPPTKDEQIAIANTLNKAEEANKLLENLIEKKRAIKLGVMQRLLNQREGWSEKSFSQIFKKYNGKAYQLKTSEYYHDGQFPIIDQGQQKIIGYTDATNKVFQCPQSGVIVFGDHTTIVKYIDFDFAIGADGTQLLGVNQGHDPKFIYYYLSLNRIPSTGYNRHFKFLQEMIFIVPEENEQKGISDVLSEMDVEIELLEKKLLKARSIKQGMVQKLLTGRIRLI